VYDFDFEWVRYAQPFLRLPWAGLYLHALSYRMRGQPNPYSGRLPCPEKMFSTRLCKGIFILDEEIVDQVSRSIGKPVVVLPDVDDMRMPVRENERALGDRLAAFAAGRPVVGLFGHLQKSKGLMVFLEAARKLAEVPVCFALGGEMDWPAEEGEKRQICRILAECPHAWTHLLRIPEETQMNYLLSKCDVLYAGYMDFPHSSGIMSKAAALRKPLIVSDGYLMANRARRFKLGEIIPQGNVAARVDAIQKLAQDTGAWKAANHPRWNEYCEEHAFARFKAGVQNLLNFV